jgi:hypothetical protein
VQKYQAKRAVSVKEKERDLGKGSDGGAEA